MPINAAFKTALENLNFDTPEAMAALNALLEAGSSDSNKFRKAIIEHANFWNPQLQAQTHNVKIETDAREEDDAFMDPTGGADAESSFGRLYQLAAEKRALSDLRKLPTNQIESLFSPNITKKEIREIFFDNSGKPKQDDRGITIKDWDSNADNVINDEAISNIVTTAAIEILLRKINRMGINPAELENDKINLEQLLAQRSKNSIKGIWGSSADDAFRDFSGDYKLFFTPELKRAIAKKLGEISIKIENDVEDLHANLDGNDKDLKEFLVGDNVKYLHDDDFNEHKTQLAVRYLTSKFASLEERKTDLIKIASAQTADMLKMEITAGSPAMDEKLAYDKVPSLSLKSHELAEIRRVAARQALKQLIEECNDPKVLTQLTDANNVAGIKKVLETSDALGLKTNSAFRDAIDEKDFAEIVAAAHIRKTITVIPSEPADKQAHLKQLKDLVLSTNPSAYYLELISLPDEYKQGHQNYNPRLQPEVDHPLYKAVKAHLGEPEAIPKLKERALISYLREEFAKPEHPTKVKNLRDSSDKDLLSARTSELMSLTGAEANQITALIGSHDNGLGLEIRRYAAVQTAINDAKTVWDLDVTDNFEIILKEANGVAETAIGELVFVKDFPIVEQHKVQTYSVQSLIYSFPPQQPPQGHLSNLKTVNLEKLALAKDATEFKTALKALGITSEDWVNDKTKEQIQKAAFIKLLDLKGQLQFGIKAHPNLEKLLAELPLSHLHYLLQKPQSLIALSQARNRIDVLRILGRGTDVELDLIEDLVRENRRLATIARIGNSEIAQRLACSPDVDLKSSNVNIINKYLADANNPANIQKFRNVLLRQTKLSLESIEQIFGDKPGDPFNPPSPISTQHEYNMDLNSEYLQSHKPSHRALLLSLAGLHKNEKIEQAEIEVLELLFEKSNYKDFQNAITRAKRPGSPASPLKTVLDKISPPLEQQISPQRFSEIKSNVIRAALSSSSFEEPLEQFNKFLNESREKLKKFKLPNTAPVERLANASAFYWFNPAFQGAAKEIALKMGTDLKELSGQSNAIIAFHENQLYQIQEALRSLPKIDPPASRLSKECVDGIKSLKAELKKLKKENLDEYNKYKRLQIWFDGDPKSESTNSIAREGVLKTLEKAVAGKTDIGLMGYKSTYVDYDLTQKKKHLSNYSFPQGVQPNEIPASIIAGADVEHFRPIDMLEPGKFREYTITSPQTGQPIACYIEERGPSAIVAKTQKDGKTEYHPSITITANKFPPSLPPKDEARVVVAMEMVSRALAGHRGPPTPENPLIINGSNPEEVKFLWTALMYIGANDPNMRFDERAIVVNSAIFDPKKELKGWFGRGTFSATSCYQQCFAEHPALRTLMQDINKINELKFGKSSTKERNQASQDASKTTKFFKDLLNDMKTENAIDAQNRPPIAPIR